MKVNGKDYPIYYGKMKNVPNHQTDRFIPQDTKVEDIHRFFPIWQRCQQKTMYFFHPLTWKAAHNL